MTRKTFWLKATQRHIQNITPAWFTVSMGTGVISALLGRWPREYGSHDVLGIFALVILAIDGVIFTSLVVAGILSCTCWPHNLPFMIRDNLQSLYLATIPMAFNTVIIGALTLLHDERSLGGYRLAYGLWGLWWVEVILSILSAVGVTYVMFTRHVHEMESLSPAWMLPVLAPIVASSGGGAFANSLLPYSQSNATLSAVVGAILVTIGVVTALMYLNLALLRLVLHKIPAGGVIYSLILPLGPCGMGGYSILLMGQYFLNALPVASSTAPFVSAPRTGELIMAFCFCTAFILWAIGLFWGVLGIIAVAERSKTKIIPFTITSWGVVFPSGVYTLLTFQIGDVLDSAVFKMLGCIFTSILATIWALMLIRTAIGILDGTVFYAPYLEHQPLASTASSQKGISSA